MFRTVNAVSSLLKEGIRGVQNGERKQWRQSADTLLKHYNGQSSRAQDAEFLGSTQKSETQFLTSVIETQKIDPKKFSATLIHLMGH